MSTIEMTWVRCHACGARWQTFGFVSRTTAGARELDARPPGAARDSVGDEVSQCETCGYAGRFIYDGPDDARAIVESVAYQRLLRAELPGLYRAFLLCSLVEERGAAFGDAGWSALRSAWVADDVGDRALSERGRRRALEMFRRAQDKRLEFAERGGSELVILADLHRRLGEHARVIELATDALERMTASLRVRPLLRYELELARAGDDSRRTLEDVPRARAGDDSILRAREAVTRMRATPTQGASRQLALAAALVELCARFHEANEQTALRAPLRELIAVQRQLYPSAPARYGPALAASLGSALELLEAGDAELEFIRDVVVAFRVLVAADPDEHWHGLMVARYRLVEALSESARADERAAVLREQLRECQTQVDAKPERYAESYAYAWEQRLRYADEVERDPLLRQRYAGLRELRRRVPDAIYREYSAALDELAEVLRAGGESDALEPLLAERVELTRPDVILVDGRRVANTSSPVRPLIDHAKVLLTLERWDDARACAEEARALLLARGDRRSEGEERSLARAHALVGACERARGREVEALSAMEEAVTVYHRLRSVELEVALLYVVVARSRAAAGRLGTAIGLVEDAADILRRRRSRDSTKHVSELVDALILLAELRRQRHRVKDARRAATEAVALARAWTTGAPADRDALLVRATSCLEGLES
ncbi:MAG: hypothetical protein KC468_13760 [Myxococcales bacterium]|nr:hypothetical protein [Myxococcales bacterium]